MFYFADFETITPETEYFKKYQDTGLIVGAIMDESGDWYREFLTLDDFVNIISQKLTSQDILFFHNLSWDGDFIMKHLFKLGYIPVNYEEEIKNKTFLIFRERHDIYKIIIGFNKNKKVTIRCSYKLLCSGIGALSKSVGLDKNSFIDDENFYNVEPVNSLDDLPPKYREYLKNDINVARLATLRYFESLGKILKKHLIYYDFKDTLTTGAISFELQQQFALKEIPAYEQNELFFSSIEDYDLAAKFFAGGITQMAPDSQGIEIHGKKITMYDINSAYPYAMTQDLPIGNLKNLKDVKPNPGEPIYKFLHLKIKRAWAKTNNCPFLKNWKKDESPQLRYRFIMTDFECFYLAEEFETLKKFYHFKGIEIIGEYWANKKPYLKKYIDEIYNLKNEYKQKGDSAGGLTYKILLNAGYGKHAQRYDIVNEFWVPTEQKAQILENKKIEVKRQYKKSPYGYKTNREVINKYEVKPIAPSIATDVNGFSNIAIYAEPKQTHKMLLASTITALNRVYLMESIYKAGTENFIYCDTDSIVLLNDDKAKVNLFIDKEKIGAWDLEQDFTMFMVKGVKAYLGMKEDKIVKARFSGINQNYLKRYGNQEWYRKEELRLIGANLKRRFCPSGVVLEKCDYISKERNW